MPINIIRIGFLKSFLNFLIASDVIDKPLSIEKRGLLLYDFCKQVYPEYTVHVSVAWIIAGLSLKKLLRKKVMTKHQNPPSVWNILQGKYKDSPKLCRLPHKTVIIGSDSNLKHKFMCRSLSPKIKVLQIFYIIDVFKKNLHSLPFIFSIFANNQ